MLATNTHSVYVSDPEAGSALALFLAAAGYEVETDFVDGAALVLAEGGALEITFRGEDLNDVARQLRARLDEPVDEVEIAELRSEFHNVA